MVRVRPVINHREDMVIFKTQIKSMKSLDEVLSISTPFLYGNQV